MKNQIFNKKFWTPFSQFLLMLFFLLSFSNLLFAQQKVITGKVEDANNTPLESVSITVKGKPNIGTTTDAKGNFSIQVSPNEILVFEFVGYQKQEINVGTNSTVDVVLALKATNLDEVVIIGYGKQERKNITSAISSVSGEQIAQMPSSNINMALQGRVSGLQVTSGGSQPGAGSTARLRGINSINVNNGPLYVVDGVITTGDIRDINPSDVESIDVLKDASAAAIYGARAAEGVIIITTKKAKAGITTINYDGYYGIQKWIKNFDFVNGRQYEQIRRQAYYDEGGNTNFLNDTTADKRYDKQIFNSLELLSIANGKSYDWPSQILHPAPIQSHTISISSGNDKNKLYTSGNYFNQGGIIKNSNMIRYSLNVNAETQISKKLKAILTSNVSHIDYKILDQQVYYNALTMSPLYPFTDSAGNSTIFMDPTKGSLYIINNPIALTGYPVIQNDDRYMGSLALEYKILNDLQFRTSLNADIYNDHKYTYYPRTVNRNNSYTQKGYGSIENFDYRDYASENILTYDYNPNLNNSLSVMAGLTYEKRRQEYAYMTGTGFPNDITSYKDMSLASNKTMGSNFFNWSVLSQMARVIYKFKDRYIINTSIRRDGVSYFGSNNRYGVFPSISGAWRIIDEPFMNSLKLKSTISDLKFRVGYGVVGNYNRTYNAVYAGMNPSGYPFDNSTVTTGFQVNTSYMANKDLKWEEQHQFNVGMDIAFFDNRLNFSGDYYNKNITNLLMPMNLPPSSGYNVEVINIARMNTRGVDLKIHADIIKNNNFQWQVEANWSTFKSKVTSLLPGVDSLRPDLKVGEAPYALFIDYVYDGLYQAGTKDSTYMRQKGIKPGSVKVKDLNNDGIINDNDMTTVGRLTPKAWGGVWNYFNYKGLSLAVFASYMYGHDIFNKAYQDYLYPDGTRVNIVQALNYWTPTNTNTDIPRPNAYSNALKTLPHGTSSFAVQKGDFIKIRNITLGYDFKAAILSKLKLRSLNLYVQLLDPFTITAFKGVDPEISQVSSGSWSGNNYELYPRYKTTLIGLKLGL